MVTMYYKEHKYNRRICISEEDIKYLLELKTKKLFRKRSLAGINSFIINYYKQKHDKS